jgi:sterol desaturase/sphingolipid hydroxylase (fatty acid hydroxylase superfamily)
MELYNSPSAGLALLPVLLVAIIVEGIIYCRRNARYPWADSAASLAIAVGHSLSGIISHTVITGGLALIVWHWRIATIDMRHWWTILALFLLLEVAYYWYHRSAHRVRLFWGSHSVHHTPEELTLSAAYRLNWTPLVSGSWLFFLPLVWIGFPPAWVFGMVSAMLIYQFWLHTTVVPRLGPLEWIFNTPSAHRVHHASNGEYLDRNYGGVLMIWDRLFGTYVRESETIPIRFGLVHSVKSKNPFVLVYQEFFGLVHDLRDARSWGERWRFIFAPPGWRPTPPPAPEATTAE